MSSGNDGALPSDLFAATVALLEELTAISSASGDAAGLGRMAARLGAALAARGLETEVLPGLGPFGRDGRGSAAGPGVGALPVLVARGPTVAEGRESPAGRGHLLLIGHLDTVLPAAPPRRDGDRLVATGAIDMKGGLATLAGALDLLARRGAAPPADLLLVAVPDEEVGGELARAAVEHWGAGARAFWVLEPGEPGSAPGAETLVGGRRGLFDWRLEARGKAAHSGLHLAEGRSALLAAARWCLEATAAPDAPDAPAAPGATVAPGEPAVRRPAVNVGRLVAGDASFVDHLAAAHAWLGTERQLNVVPDAAIAEGEARFSTAASGEETALRLAGLAAAVGAATGTTLAFRHGRMIPPVDSRGPQQAWCARAVALAANRGWRLEVEEERGGISFPNFLPDPGRLPVLDGLGPIGGGMHTRDEYVDLVSLSRRIVLLADLLQEDAANRGQPADSRTVVPSR
ncbi:MAG TPA: M20/M25/M40 family metallo-hydrolase [Thermoanaerobaculia bacterium]|nr:M20/M25/M40 family metallo-hydrolase [Thermoanaerobaculia bacterium]